MPAGVLLNTYELGNYLGFGRIALDPGDLNTMWVFTQSNDNLTNLLFSVNLTTEAQTTPLQIPAVFTGQSSQTGDPEDLDSFGIATSCPIIILAEEIPGEPPVSDPPGPGSPDCPCPCDPDTGGPPSLGTPLMPPIDEPLVPWSARCGYGGVMPDGNDTVSPESWL